MLKTLSKNQNQTSIKGRNPVANLQKNNNGLYHQYSLDLVNDNEYTKFDLILSFRSADIE